jgi:hypothetical protein
MQRFVMWAIALAVAGLGATGTAQTRVSTAEEYAKAMRMTSTSFGAVRTALSSRNFADAKEKLAVAREGFAALEGFWVARDKDDAVGIVRTALAQIDEIDALLDVERPSRADTLAMAKMVQGACVACHELYREGDNATGFRFREGVL